MFHSGNNNRQYRAYSPSCLVHGLTSSESQMNSQVIILPFPFDVIKLDPYCDPITGNFLKLPYYHNVADENKFNGQIRVNSSVLEVKEEVIKHNKHIIDGDGDGDDNGDGNMKESSCKWTKTESDHEILNTDVFISSIADFLCE